MCDVEAYFETRGEELVPTAHAAGHWADDSLSGRSVLGLAAWAFERALPDEEWLPARLTLDLVQMGRMAPVTVTTRTRRQGRTVEVVDLEFSQADRIVALVRGVATCAPTPPPGEAWGRDLRAGSVPADQLYLHPGQQMALATARGDFATADFRSGVAAWSQDDQSAPSLCWMREHARVVAEHEETAYTRLGLLADVANSVVNWGRGGLQVINPDLTLAISRLPTGDAVGLETLERVLHGGTSVGVAAVHDEAGPVGLVSVTSVHQPVFSGISAPAES